MLCSLNIELINSLTNKFQNMNFEIYNEFVKFIKDYRILRKQLKIEKKKKIEEDLLNEKKSKVQNLENESLCIKEINKIEENLEIEKISILADVQLDAKKRLQALRKIDSTENENNSESDYVKHKRSEVLLSELNNKIQKQALLDRIISNSDITLKEVVMDKKQESIFTNARLKPPKK